jgi:hypothetical protein
MGSLCRKLKKETARSFGGKERKRGAFWVVSFGWKGFCFVLAAAW